MAGVSRAFRRSTRIEPLSSPSPRPELGQAVEPWRQLREAYPRSCILGCSTSGEILGARVTDGTASVAVARFERGRLASASASVPADGDSFAAGVELARRLIRARPSQHHRPVRRPAGQRQRARARAQRLSAPLGGGDRRPGRRRRPLPADLGPGRRRAAQRAGGGGGHLRRRRAHRPRLARAAGRPAGPSGS